MTAGYYAIVAPGTIHPNTLYNVVVSVHDVAETCKIKLTLKGPKFEQCEEVDVPINTTVNSGFEIPNIANGDYTLNVEGISGLVFTKNTILNFEDNRPAVFIQTDKAKYKPGDLVQFRVVFLDQNIRPANIEQFSIFIKDAAKNRIKQFQNLKLTKGVISEKLQLSEFPVLGEWEIEVHINGEMIKKKSFDVEEYVLPKFEVIIDTTKKALILDEKFGFTIRSRYTFGKSVNGRATVKFSSRAAYDEHSFGQFRRFHCGPSFQSPYVIEKEVQKTIEINGKAYVEFDISDLKPESLVAPNDMKSKITAIVEEELTGNKQQGTAELIFVWNRFEISAPHITIDKKMSTKKFIYAITIADFDNVPVTDDKHPVKLTIQSYQKIEMESFLIDGIAKFELDCSGDWNYLSVDIEYRDQKAVGSITQSLESSSNFWGEGVQMITKQPEIGKSVEVEVKSNEVLSSFVYVIVARGNIVQNGFVNLAENNTKQHKFNVDVTFEMMPTAHIYVYYLQDKNLKFFENCFNVEKCFTNKISIEAPTQAQPGDSTTIKVKTNNDSYVGLMAVDQSVLLLKSGNDFDKDQVLNSLDNLKSDTPSQYMQFMDPHPGSQAGLITLTNASYPCRPMQLYTCGFAAIQSRAMYAVPQAISYQAEGAFYDPPPKMKLAEMAQPEIVQPRIRKDFSESWFIADFPSSGETDLTITKKLPDTITSWIISGFSLNSNTGFALCDAPAKIQTFRPFFITTNLPYSVKRGEIVTIPVLVFNYMEQPLDVKLSFDNSDGDFQFIDKISEQEHRIMPVTVYPNNAEIVNFIIRPERIGQIILKITAISHIAGDAIHKKLKVEPEGITIFENRDFYVQTSEEQIFTDKLVLDIPEKIVSGSEHIEISLMGDILSSTVCNFDKLVRMPYGCGEQNMINFVPNILVLLYLESIKQLNPSIESKAKRYMEIGYQRELTYKHDDGSYSAFGKSDKAGSTWLTAYVIRSFHQAARYIDIEEKILNEGLEFLAAVQAADGSFPEHGKLFDFSHQNEIGLTAFVLLAFLENPKAIPKYKEVIDKGFHFLEEKIRNLDDLYAISLAVYALQMHKSSVVPDIMTKLNEKAQVSGGRKWWTKSTPDSSIHSWRRESHDVEINGYLLMTLLDMKESVLPITKWLISQRNSNGGFESTQETVVGLQALVKFAEKSGAGESNLTVDFEVAGKDNSVYKSQIESNKPNNLEMITHVLPEWAREISVKGKGSGTAVLQISYQYNIELKEKQPSFKLETRVQPKPTLQKLEMEVSVEYKPLESEAERKISNMAVMEVCLPSGYIAKIDSFDKIKKIDNVKRVETKNGDTNVIIYFDGLEKNKGIKVPVEAERVHEVSEQKPVAVVIYDYYDSLKRATIFYNI